MDHGNPWSLKGVDEDAQDVARLAARRAGMSLGEWLNQVIREQAAAAAPPRTAATVEAPSPEAPSPDAPSADSWRRAAQAAGETGADRRTIAALDKIARWIDEQERSEPPPAAARKAGKANAAQIETVRDSIELIAARLKTLDRTIERSADNALQPLRETLRHLQLHLPNIEDGLVSGRTDGRRANEELRELDQRLAEIGLRIGEIADGRAKSGDEPRSERIGRIESKLAALVDAVNSKGPRGAGPASAELPPKKASTPKPSSTAKPLPPAQMPQTSRFEDAVEEIRALQRRLDGLSDDTRGTDARSDDILHDDVRKDDARKPAAPSSKVSAGDMYEELTQRIAARQDEAARKDEAETQTRATQAREKPASAPSARNAGRIESELRVMRETMAQTLGREAIKPVLTALDELTARVETAGTGISAGLREDMRETLRELARAFESSLASSKPLRSIGAIATQVEDLGRKFDVMAGLTTDRDGFERLSGQIGDLHSLVKQGAARGKAPDPGALEKLEGRIDTLIDRLERQPKQLQQVLGAQGLGGQSLGGQVLNDQVPNRQVPAADLSSLETLIQSLAERIDNVRQPEAGSDALEALERQIGRLTEKLEGSSGPDLSGLASLERSISELFGQIESVRYASREAAGDAVREALLHAAPRGETAPALESVKRDMADLRQSREQVDQRTQDTLEAVHGALEKVVDRLAALEREVTSERAPPESFRAEPARAEPARQPGRQKTQETPRAKLSSRLPFWKSSGEKPAAPTPKAEPRLPPRPDFASEHPDLLEPGSGRPKTRQGSGHHGAEPQGNAADAAALAETKANFIAAARRAAQSAAAETAQAKGKKVTAEADADSAGFLESRKKPILLGLAALTMAAMALSVFGRYETRHSAAVVATPAQPAPETTQSAAAPSKPAERPSASSGLLSPEPSSGAARFDGSGDAPRPLAGPSSQFAPVMPPLPSPASTDPVTVGSIPRGGLPEIPSGIGSGILRAAAAKGDPAAAYEVGVRLIEGRGVARDPRLAVRWLERAAAEGLAPAQFRLGNLHEKGLGVPRDPKLAKAWYQRAADKGNAKALHNLAVLLAEGVDGKPDYTAAAQAFRKASELGVRDSQYNLAILYARGLGVAQSLSEAYLWLAVAAEQGDEEAAKKREDVAARLSPPDLVLARSNAERFRPAKPDALANEVSTPAGGWESASTSKTDKARAGRG